MKPRIAFLLFIVLVAGCAGNFVPAPEPPHLRVFHASWCGYCPTEAEINAWKRGFPGVDIISIDIDSNRKLANEFGVSSIPFYVICTDDGCWATHSTTAIQEWLRTGQKTDADQSFVCPVP